MRLFFVILVSASALLAAGQQATSQTPAATKAPAKSVTKAAPKTAATPAPKATDASKPAAIPEGAVADENGDFRYTDPQGKKWIYRRTPFGVTRLEDSAELAAAKAAAASGAGIKAMEDGDVVHFERKGPFGVWKWDKKKSEMDEAEKAALQHSQAENKTPSKD